MALLFPSTTVARRCADFILNHAPSCRDNPRPELEKNVRIIDLVFQAPDAPTLNSEDQETLLSAVLYPHKYSSIASKFWQHWGDGISSRRADFFHQAFSEGHLVQRDGGNTPVNSVKTVQKGPRRYQRTRSTDLTASSAMTELQNGEGTQQQNDKATDHIRFVEERFGRNLDLSLASYAKLAIRRRIAGSLTNTINTTTETGAYDASPSNRHDIPVSESDVYLFPTGMSAISNAHRMILKARGPLKSIMFG